MTAPLSTTGQPKLLDRLRPACRARHYSLRTEDAYHDWCKRFILFHGKRHPQEMGEPEVNAFLTHRAVDRTVAASTQNQAMAAVLFLYAAVLERPLNRLHVVRAKRPERLPIIPSRAEVQQIMDHLSGTPRLIALLLYGAGLRVTECLSLRVHDVDFDRMELLVCHGKGGKDRRTMLPSVAAEPLREHVGRARGRFEARVPFFGDGIRRRRLHFLLPLAIGLPREGGHSSKRPRADRAG